MWIDHSGWGVQVRTRCSLYLLGTRCVSFKYRVACHFINSPYLHIPGTYPVHTKYWAVLCIATQNNSGANQQVNGWEIKLTFLLFMLFLTLLYVVLLSFTYVCFALLSSNRRNKIFLNLSVLTSNLSGGSQNQNRVTLNCAAMSRLNSVAVKARRCTPAGTRTGRLLVTTAGDPRSEITTTE